MHSGGRDRGNSKASGGPAQPESNDLGPLGFGPDSLLMNDPKLFVDARFLSALLGELDAKLGQAAARIALFQIGLSHGFRDAGRVAHRDFFSESTTIVARPCEPTSLIMQLCVPRTQQQHRLEIAGSWPECYESQARLERFPETTSPSCFLSAGYTSGWLSGTHGTDILATETACAAAGARHCTFDAHEVVDWSDPDGLVDGLTYTTFERFRLMATNATPSHAPALADPSAPPPNGFEEGDFDPDEDAVHIWGPVMILPFTSADEVLATVELLGRDPDTCDVRVVVIDLRGQPLDAGFGAAGLEQVLATIESWSADTILTGVSPLSEVVVGDLEVKHLLTRKDLPDAIASAFQIAEAQRHVL